MGGPWTQTWPLAKTILTSKVCVTPKDREDVHVLCCHLKPCVRGSCYHQRPCRCLWSALPLETMLMSMGPTATGDHISVCGPYCPRVLAGSLALCCYQGDHAEVPMLLTETMWKLIDPCSHGLKRARKLPFAVVLKTADSQKRDMGGFCENPYPHPATHTISKTKQKTVIVSRRHCGSQTQTPVLAPLQHFHREPPTIRV